MIRLGSQQPFVGLRRSVEIPTLLLDRSEVVGENGVAGVGQESREQVQPSRIEVTSPHLQIGEVASGPEIRRIELQGTQVGSLGSLSVEIVVEDADRSERSRIYARQLIQTCEGQVRLPSLTQS